MSEKTIEKQITEKREELAALEARQYDSAKAEYPKWVTDPNDPSKGFTVANKDQEDAIRAGGKGAGSAQGSGATAGNTFDPTPEEQEAQRSAKAEADKEAAKGKSRLSGPEPEADSAKEQDRKRAEANKAEKDGQKRGRE